MDQKNENFSDDLVPLLGITKAGIIRELSYSELSVEELSHLFNMNKNAINEHLASLELKGYLNAYFKGNGPGRPKKYYKLSEKGFNLLPKRYMFLASLLVKELETEFGQDKVNIILGNVADKIVSESGWDQMPKDLTREKKIDRLHDFVSALNRMGYYAKLEIDGDVVRIIRHNCIFYELAKNNKSLICGGLGNQIIKESIGKDFKIKEKFSEGSNKCVVEVNI